MKLYYFTAFAKYRIGRSEPPGNNSTPRLYRELATALRGPHAVLREVPIMALDWAGCPRYE